MPHKGGESAYPSTPGHPGRKPVGAPKQGKAPPPKGVPAPRVSLPEEMPGRKRKTPGRRS